MTEAAGPLRVLLIEDNPADVYLTRLMFERLKAFIELSVANDGALALELLGLDGTGRETVQPDLILLDLNLPKVDGWELLRRVKSHAGLGSIPVVVLSSARSVAEVNTCYQLHASAFVTKPDDPRQMEALLRNLSEFWFRTATLPRC